MSLQDVDLHVQACLVSGVEHPGELLDGLGTDQPAVGLEHRPQREDPHVVEAESRDGLEIGFDVVEGEVEPVVKPALGRGVVHAETQG
jgi:hypothetical protein